MTVATLAVLGLLAAGVLRPPAAALAAAEAHAVLVDAERVATEASLHGWDSLTTRAFRVYFEPDARAQALLVEAALDRFYPEVAHDFGLPAGAQWPVVVVSPARMTAIFGGAADNPPLGAYFRGVVWLLEPDAVVGPGATAALYEQYGPVPHELTHLADDLVSGGRTPRWLDEGIAQYEEWRLNGYVWEAVANRFNLPRYSWAELTGQFDALPNVALAYRQALAATAVICRPKPGDCLRVLEALRSGASPSRAIAAVIGGNGLRALEAGAAWASGSGPRSGEPAGPAP